MPEFRRMLRTFAAHHGIVLVALAFLLGSCASFHGYRLACQECQECLECPGAEVTPSGSPDHRRCEDCKQMCCFAVSVAIAGDHFCSWRPSRPGISSPSSAPAPRGALSEFFRPPLV